MNHIRSHSNIVLTAIALAVFASIVLVAVAETRANFFSRLEELVRIKDEVSPVAARFSGPSRLEELARIKDDLSPAARLSGPSRLEELARIKER